MNQPDPTNPTNRQIITVNHIIDSTLPQLTHRLAAHNIDLNEFNPSTTYPLNQSPRLRNYLTIKFNHLAVVLRVMVVPGNSLFVDIVWSDLSNGDYSTLSEKAYSIEDYRSDGSEPYSGFSREQVDKLVEVLVDELVNQVLVYVVL